MASAPAPRRVVVIGAGAAGLATAGLLARAGYTVTVVDNNPRIGGRADSLEVAGFRFDTGPSWYLMPEAFDHFYELMGTSTAAELELTDLTPAYRVYSGPGDSLDVPSGVEEAAAVFESLEPGAGQALRDYLTAAGESYDIAVRTFLYTTFSRVRPFLTREVLRKLPTLLRLLTTSLQDYAARSVRTPRLQQILTYPAVFLATRPETAPALYHLMSHTDLVQGVRYPQGGFAAVLDSFARLATAAGATIRLSTTATEIVTTAPRGGQARVTGVTVTTSTGEQEFLAADYVVSGADLHHTECTLLPPRLRSYPQRWWRRRDPGPGTVLVMLGVAGTLPQLTHHTLLFSPDWAPDFDAVFDGPRSDRPHRASQSIYISKPSATDPDVAPAGMDNLFVLIPVPADTAIGHGDAFGHTPSETVTAIADQAVDQIARWLEVPDLRERITVMRTVGPADHAGRYHAFRGGSLGLAHTLRQSAFLRGSNRSAKVDGLFYAGSTTVPGVGIPMCLISAENVLKRLRGDSSSAPLEAPLTPQL